MVPEASQMDFEKDKIEEEPWAPAETGYDNDEKVDPPKNIPKAFVSIGKELVKEDKGNEVSIAYWKKARKQPEKLCQSPKNLSGGTHYHLPLNVIPLRIKNFCLEFTCTKDKLPIFWPNGSFYHPRKQMHQHFGKHLQKKIWQKVQGTEWHQLCPNGQ